MRTVIFQSDFFDENGNFWKKRVRHKNVPDDIKLPSTAKVLSGGREEPETEEESDDSDDTQGKLQL